MRDVNLLISNGVNIKKSLELFGDMETYDDTLTEFMSSIDKKLADIKSFKEQGDMANYAIQVHSLKSDCRYFGFEKLADIAYNHELESKANNIYFVTEHYDELINEANRIIKLINSYVNGITTSSAPVEQAEPVVAPPVKNQSILVADDSDIIRNFIKKIFNNDYNILSATDGAEALEIIKNENNNIKAVLLDLNMPHVDGYAVLDYFDKNNLFKKMPISIITGDGSKEAISKACAYPIVDVLSKPFNEINIKKVVEKTIESGL